MCWDSRVVVCEDFEVGGFSVLRGVEDNFRWVFTGVYDPVVGAERTNFLNEIASVAFKWELPWCVGGDFNVVRYPEERWVNHGVSCAMRNFNGVINDLQLLDLPMQGGDVTWSNGSSGSRLDRFLVSGEWEEHFSNATQTRLGRSVSDH